MENDSIVAIGSLAGNRRNRYRGRGRPRSERRNEHKSTIEMGATRYVDWFVLDTQGGCTVSVFLLSAVPSDCSVDTPKDRGKMSNKNPSKGCTICDSKTHGTQAHEAAIAADERRGRRLTEEQIREYAKRIMWCGFVESAVKVLKELLSAVTLDEPDRITVSKEHFNKLCQMAADKKYGAIAERERIRNAIINDQATCSGDYSEAEEYADIIVGKKEAPTPAEPMGNCDLVSSPHPQSCCGKAWKPFATPEETK